MTITSFSFKSALMLQFAACKACLQILVTWSQDKK
jgi:hypothetical protein